jgi:hypothetical protein
VSNTAVTCDRSTFTSLTRGAVAGSADLVGYVDRPSGPCSVTAGPHGRFRAYVVIVVRRGGGPGDWGQVPLAYSSADPDSNS